MKMEKTKMFGLLSLGVLAILGISLVAAYQGDYSMKGPNYSEERHEAMETAFDNLDYDAWSALMAEDGRHPRVLDVVTADNFAEFAAVHEAMESGDFEKASELKAELGLSHGQGSRDGSGFGAKDGMHKGSGMGGQGNNGECPYAE